MAEGREKIKACVGVLIFKDGKILLGKRKGSHGNGEYSCPGGHLEFGESFEECAERETLEETGVKIKNIKFQCVSNIFRHENRQDVLVSFVADWESGECKIMEPEKCDGWGWYDFDNLPSPLFYPSELIIDSYKTGKNYYDKE
jgi:8-oxo-dGTP diphosphatase